jgi:flavin-dependent dehydrogenase
MSPRLHDVIIVGAGPSGATAANLLAQQGLDVLIVDRSQQPSAQLPQTCLGLRTSLLSKLGVDGEIFAALEVPKPVRFLGAEGGFDFQIAVEPSGSDTGYQGMRLNRTYFDQSLIQSAVHHGAAYFCGLQIEQFIEQEGGIRGVRCRTVRGVEDYHARAVIDASGKSALLANQLGLRDEGQKLDDRNAVFSHYIGTDFAQLLPNGGMTVFASEGGYVLLAPMSGQRVSVIAVMADSQAAFYGNDRKLFFETTVGAWQALRCAIGRAQQVLPILPVINHTSICRHFNGPGYFIVGEAAAFSDPFISNGLAFAMDSGELAAQTLIDAWQDQGDLILPRDRTAYDRQTRELLQLRQQEAHDWLDGIAARRLVMACADPHLPWIVPFALLNLLFGAGFKYEGELNRQGTALLAAARSEYSNFVSPV